MGGTKTRNSCFLFFLNFLFLGKKWETRNKKSIFFIFCLILAKFWTFLMIFQSKMMIIHIFGVSRTFLGCSFAFIGVLGVGSWTAWTLVCSDFTNLQCYIGENFFLFFSCFLQEMVHNFLFLARNQKARKIPPILHTPCIHLHKYEYKHMCVDGGVRVREPVSYTHLTLPTILLV